MRCAAATSVGDLLEQQVEIIGGPGVSLHSLWRAAGCPGGSDPGTWADLASSFIAGLARYHRTLTGEKSRGDDVGGVLWPWKGTDGEPWRTGDLMAHHAIARVYAEFLGRGGDEDVARAIGE